MRTIACNPQTFCGATVIARVHASNRARDLLETTRLDYVILRGKILLKNNRRKAASFSWIRRYCSRNQPSKKAITKLKEGCAVPKEKIETVNCGTVRGELLLYSTQPKIRLFLFIRVDQITQSSHPIKSIHQIRNYHQHHQHRQHHHQLAQLNHT